MARVQGAKVSFAFQNYSLADGYLIKSNYFFVFEILVRLGKFKDFGNFVLGSSLNLMPLLITTYLLLPESSMFHLFEDSILAMACVRVNPMRLLPRPTSE